MKQCTVLICFVLFGLGVLEALPSVNNVASVTVNTPTAEEIDRMITTLQTQKIILLTSKTTPASGPMSKEITSTPPLLEQLTVAQNLTKYFEELVKSVKDLAPQTTPAQASAYDIRLEKIERAIQNLTESILRLEIAASTTTPAPPLCGSSPGYEYWSVSKSCYKAHTEMLTWQAADEACLAEGAYLAVVNNHNEAHYLSNISKSMPSILNTFVGVFRDSADQWTTVTGETVNKAAGYRMWASSEPYSGREWLYASLAETGELISRSVTDVSPFICEKSP